MLACDLIIEHLTLLILYSVADPWGAIVPRRPPAQKNCNAGMFRLRTKHAIFVVFVLVKHYHSFNSIVTANYSVCMSPQKTTKRKLMLS